MVVVSYDSADTLKRAAARRGITFLLLSDPGSKTIDSFGILNKEAQGRAKGIPHPGIFILDQAGIIRAKLFLESYKQRATSADVVRALQQLPSK